mmetsp:Transcript_3026/g.6408  ORF Transcript_3026/g.6408 Transcript_3026/m.6408 type:complete len:348 (-) Transcript_3026:504-1547(-)
MSCKGSSAPPSDKASAAFPFPFSSTAFAFNSFACMRNRNAKVSPATTNPFDADDAAADHAPLLCTAAAAASGVVAAWAARSPSSSPPPTNVYRCGPKTSTRSATLVVHLVATNRRKRHLSGLLNRTHCTERLSLLPGSSKKGTCLPPCFFFFFLFLGAALVLFSFLCVPTTDAVWRPLPPPPTLSSSPPLPPPPSAPAAADTPSSPANFSPRPETSSFPLPSTSLHWSDSGAHVRPSLENSKKNSRTRSRPLSPNGACTPTPVTSCPPKRSTVKCCGHCPCSGSAGLAAIHDPLRRSGTTCPSAVHPNGNRTRALPARQGLLLAPSPPPEAEEAAGVEVSMVEEAES